MNTNYMPGRENGVVPLLLSPQETLPPPPPSPQTYDEHEDQGSKIVDACLF